MKLIHKLINILFIICGMISLFRGVTEFGDSDTWLQAFKGLFWMIVGVLCYFTTSLGMTDE